MPKIAFKRIAQDQFASLPQNLQEDVDEALMLLYADAEAGLPLRGNLRGRWRLAVGSIRVLYRIREDGRLVVVDSVSWRVPRSRFRPDT